MTKLNLIAIAIVSSVAFGNTAFAQSAPVAPVATIASPAMANADRVCAGTFVLSEAAKLACSAKAYPRLLKDGSRFANVGIGAEFNTLIRQLPATN